MGGFSLTPFFIIMPSRNSRKRKRNNEGTRHARRSNRGKGFRPDSGAAVDPPVYEPVWRVAVPAPPLGDMLSPVDRRRMRAGLAPR